MRYTILILYSLLASALPLVFVTGPPGPESAGPRPRVGWGVLFYGSLPLPPAPPVPHTPPR